MRTKRNRSFRPEISGLEGRQLLSMVGSPKVFVGSPKAAEPSPKAVVGAPKAIQAPAVTTFGDTSNAAPALVEFRGKTLLVWSSSFDGAVNVATVAKGSSGFQLESKERLGVALAPDKTPAATVFDGRLYLAWTGPDGHLNVISSADGVHFTNKVNLPDTSNAGPTLAAFNGRLYLGWTGTTGQVNIESSANGMSFSNKITYTSLYSYISSGGHQVDLSPALATFGGRLYLACTLPDTRLVVLSAANGTAFSGFILGEKSDAAPALTVEQAAVKGQPARLVLGWIGVGNNDLNTMTSTDGRTFGGKVTSGQTGFGGLALASPSAGTLDIAWTGAQTGLRHLNLMQA